MRLIVQHHPRRAHLLGTFDGLDPIVVADPDPDARRKSAWRSYRVCLELARTLPEAHVVIVQDDAVPCPGFLRAAEVAHAAEPDALVCYYMPPFPSSEAKRVVRNGSGFLRLRPGWAPAVAIGWPTVLIEPFLRWCDETDVRDDTPSDDGVIGRWSRNLIPVLATTPSLIEHPDIEPPVLRRTTRVNRVPRLAASYVGDDVDSWIERVAPSPHRSLT